MDPYFQPEEIDSNDARLELEFRQILCIIKNSIIYVNSSYNLSFYRAWIEKLNTPCADKYLRNTFLIRLARQIQGNYLSHTFDKNPPSGPLRRLDDTSFESSDVGMDTFKYDDEVLCSEKPQRLVHAPQVAYNPNSLSIKSNSQIPSSNFEIVKDNTPPFRENNGKSLSMLKDEFVPESYDNKSPSKLKKRRAKPGNYKSCEGNFSKSTVSEDRPQLFEEPVKDARKGKIGNIQEDSSWYDLTDTSLTSIILNPLGSGDAGRCSRIPTFKGYSNEIQKKIDISTVKNYSNSSQCEKNVNQEDQETKEMRICLKDTHYISNDWKQTIESLQLRLTETVTQNNELKFTIQNLTEQIILETRKREETENYQNELREQHLKEIQVIQKVKEEDINRLEQSFQSKLDEIQRSFDEKHNELSKNYEIKINDLKVDNENIKKEKDKEIFRLSEIIQNQCSRISDEIKALRNQMEAFSGKNNSEEKIFNLQRCVSKMDKLFHKSEKEYLKQIEKLKQDLTKQEKVAQIQLKTQKADLIAAASVEKQRQFDELVNNLEVKYIKMLEYHETEVMENKKEDEDKIEYLKHLLNKFDIPYNIT